MLTLGAGLFAAGALIFTALNFNLLRRNSEQADQRQRRSHELTEQGQVTERYTKAIEQLGSDKLDVRIGGIYALERVACDSVRDHPTVMEVLTAFVREHPREPWPEPDPGRRNRNNEYDPTFQAAVTVIGRGDPARDVQRINLSRAKLSRATLSGADLTDATPWARTSPAHTSTRRSSPARSSSADLSDTIFLNADFTRVDLSSVNWPENAPVPEGWKRIPNSGLLSQEN